MDDRSMWYAARAMAASSALMKVLSGNYPPGRMSANAYAELSSILQLRRIDGDKDGLLHAARVAGYLAMWAYEEAAHSEARGVP